MRHGDRASADHGHTDESFEGLHGQQGPDGVAPYQRISVTSSGVLQCLGRSPRGVRAVFDAADFGLGGVCGRVGALAPARVLRRGQGDNVFPSPCGRRRFCAALRGRRDRRPHHWVTPRTSPPPRVDLGRHDCGSGGPPEAALFVIVSGFRWGVVFLSLCCRSPTTAHLASACRAGRGGRLVQGRPQIVPKNA